MRTIVFDKLAAGSIQIDQMWTMQNNKDRTPRSRQAPKGDCTKATTITPHAESASDQLASASARQYCGAHRTECGSGVRKRWVCSHVRLLTRYTGFENHHVYAPWRTSLRTIRVRFCLRNASFHRFSKGPWTYAGSLKGTLAARNRGGGLFPSKEIVLSVEFGDSGSNGPW